MSWLLRSAILLSCSAMRSSATRAPDGTNNENRSLAFVFDTTASMRVDYEQFKNNVQNTMQYVWERTDSNVKHFVFVPFNDPDVGEVSETLSPDQSSSYMNDLLHKKIHISGGGDCPEKSLTAVVKALEAVNHDSHVFLFTDASPKDSYTVEKALALVQRKRTRIVVLNTGENCLSLDKSYERITSLGLGHVFDICKNDVSNILKFIKSSIFINCEVNLMYVNSPLSKTVPYSTKLIVDRSIKNLMITVSGLNSKLDVTSPKGKKNDRVSEKLTTDLDLKNVKVVSVKEPAAGEWTLNVTSESPHSVRACGIGYSKNCVYGFATKEPKTMYQTVHRPLAGTKNYVLIDCPDAKHFSCCNILDLNGDGKNIPLLKTEKNVLLCGPFKPNNSPFYVQICGTASNDDFFKRISTSVIPVKQGKPHFKKNEETIDLFEGEDHLMECKDDQTTVSQIEWLVNNSEITPDDDHILAINQYKRVIYDARLNDSNVYTCRASSENTVTENRFNVTVKVYAGNSVANESFTGKLDSTVILPCRIPNNTQWFKDSKPIEDERGDTKRLKQIAAGFRISYLRESDAASYSCVNRANETYTVDLQVEFEPYFVAENEPEPLAIPRQHPEPVAFDCAARGTPKLKIKWRKNNKPLTRWHFEDIEFLENEQKLKILPVDAHDWTAYNGTYSCLIKNKLGNETRSFQLTVI